MFFFQMVPVPVRKMRGPDPQCVRQLLIFLMFKSCYTFVNQPSFLVVLDEREFLGGIEEPENILNSRLAA